MAKMPTVDQPQRRRVDQAELGVQTRVDEEERQEQAQRDRPDQALQLAASRPRGTPCRG